MSFNPDLLKGRAALVTGGGTGIGRGIALAFASYGCDVAISSRKPEHLVPTAAEIERLGVRSLALPADVRDYAQVEAAVGRMMDTFGRFDILVNGAAGNFICLAENLSANGFGTVVDIDLKGTFNVSRAAFQHLRAGGERPRPSRAETSRGIGESVRAGGGAPAPVEERLAGSGGVILNISATLQLLGTVGQSHASAAKAGIDSLTRSLAVEWGPSGIRVNGLAPGPVDGTEGVKRLVNPAARRHIEQSCPLGRMATIDEVAQAAVYLCSDASAFITGVTVVIDGGLWLRSARALAAD
jgi:peroxisomal 2,4-dienoyl-CoA reductase